jgi:hypothetical protein
MNNKRYWITTDNVVIREWRRDEYNNLEPTTRIQEDVLWNVCMNCGHPFSPTTQVANDMNGDNPYKHFCWECNKKKYNWFFKPKNRNNGYAYLKTELTCFESGYKDIDGKQCFVTTMY